MISVFLENVCLWQKCCVKCSSRFNEQNLMKFCALVLELHFATKFLSQTPRYFPETVKSLSRHPKTWKSIKYRKSKICTKPILSSIYNEESKKKNHAPRTEYEEENSVAFELLECHNLHAKLKYYSLCFNLSV